jgi:glycosyltransferase involved in cell wall biosynthesis
MKYSNYILKRKLEAILIAPFVIIGKIVHLVLGHKNNYELYFFFPFYHLGGAEKIHLQIAQIAKGKKALIVFTRKSTNLGFLESFKEIGIDIEIASAYTNNDILRLPLNLIARGFYSSRINNDKATVFNGQSNFGYKISPWINESLNQIELIHSFNSFSWIRVPYISYYTKTVMISEKKIEAHFSQYDQIQVPKKLKNKIIYIPNAVDTLTIQIDKKWAYPLKIVYVGRGSVEKRIPSIVNVAKKVKEYKLSFEFELIGDVDDYVTKDANKFLKIAGMINNKAILNSKYQSAHFIILLSSTEGMPLVILEAMQNGCIPIVTNVGDLPFVINKDNGFIMNNDEATIIDDTYHILESITNTNFELLKTLSNNCISTIEDKYSMKQFEINYKNLLCL